MKKPLIEIESIFCLPVFIKQILCGVVNSVGLLDPPSYIVQRLGEQHQILIVTIVGIILA